MKKTLHLTLKKKWFDMILSGEKKEEYREIKPYWVTRLCNGHNGCLGGEFMHKHKVIAYTFKHFDTIRFTNGYGKNAPYFDIECKGTRICEGNPDWGGSGTTFILSLGNIIK